MIKYLASQPLNTIFLVRQLQYYPSNLVFDTWQEAKDFLVTQSRNRLASLREDLMREQAKLSRLQAMQPPEDNNVSL